MMTRLLAILALFLAAPTWGQTPTPTPDLTMGCCVYGAGCDIPPACVDQEHVFCNEDCAAICSLGACSWEASSCNETVGCPTNTPTPSPILDCCSPNPGPGCNDPNCMAVICGVDEQCCTEQWDQKCSNEASGLCPNVPCRCACAPTLTPTPTVTYTVTAGPSLTPTSTRVYTATRLATPTRVETPTRVPTKTRVPTP